VFPPARQRHVPTPQGTPLGSAHAFNAPTQKPVTSPGPFRPILAPRSGPDFGQTSPSPAASTGLAECQSGTLLGATGGTQTHSRRTDRKLGQLRYARQGLVRVPESNTKYGGKGGKTGVGRAPVIDPSISESSGIPKGKNSQGHAFTRLGPAVHRASIFRPSRIAFWRLRWLAEILRAAMPAHPW
jgi:hypothetical protein